MIKPPWLKSQKTIKTWLILLAIAGVIAWISALQIPAKGQLAIYFLDIGQGDATLIQEPDGDQTLIDGGPGSSVLEQLGNQMPYWDKTIEQVVLTHPDADHLGGLVEVLKNYQVDRIITTDAVHTSNLYREWLGLIEEKKVPVEYPKQGADLDWGEGLHFWVLWPERSFKEGQPKNLNDTSLVGRLTYGATSFIFPGDAEISVLDKIADSPYPLKSDVAHASHHGAKNGADEKFFEKVDPDWVIISVGANNRYGHPTAEALDLFNRIGAQIRRTDQDGTILATSDGNNVSIR